MESSSNNIKDETSDTSDCATVDDVQRALNALHLPLRPLCAEKVHDHGTSNTPNVAVDRFPSITILVCADFDLKSTAALAEYALRQQNEVFDAQSIDLIIAAGPGVGDSEMLKYYQGKNKLKHAQSRNAKFHNFCRNNMSDSRLDHSYAKDDGTDNTEDLAMTAPFFRSREESAALEGLMTAALSQLESIVCRVVYCPGWNDPISLLQQQQQPKRLTSHSRNVHQHYLPLAPGLGCSGLFYLDHTEHLSDHFKISENDTVNIQNGDNNTLQQNDGDGDDSESSDQEDGYALLCDQLAKLQQLPGGYYQSLENLLQLAPKPNYPNVLFNGRNKGQSILITHYVDSRTLIDIDKSTSSDYDDDSFDEMFELRNPVKEENSSSLAVNINSESNVDDNDDTSGPWPVAHDKFLNSSIARQNLCLEIASGLSSQHYRPEWIPSASLNSLNDDVALNGEAGSTMKGPGVLIPGSLRQHGDFCIVHMSLVQQHVTKDSTTCTWGWEIQDVEFHVVNNYS